MKLQRWDWNAFAGVATPASEDYMHELSYGDWCASEDVDKLEDNMDEAIRLLIEARHVCAYPDMNTGLLAEIDTLLKKMGKTNLPELH